MSIHTEAVASFYDGYVAVEQGRLDRHRTEFAVTQRAIQAYLPHRSAHILDDGSGPGRYALWLAAQGHTVTLLDLSQQNLHAAQEQARRDGLHFAKIHHGSATDLSAFANAQFDAVLLLGPLYHLPTERERTQAVQEAVRVLRPRGVLFAAFLNLYELWRYAAQYNPHLLIQEPDVFEALLTTGIAQFRAYPTAFSSFAYWTHPLEIEPLMAQFELEQLAIIGCEGIVSNIEEAINELEGEAWERWVEWNYLLGQRPELRASSIHILYVGRKL